MHHLYVCNILLSLTYFQFYLNTSIENIIIEMLVKGWKVD